MIDKVNEKECVGCKACGDVCSKNAIVYDIKDDGFWYPRIEDEKCVQCNLCEDVCPILQNRENVERQWQNPEIFSAYIRDKEIRYNSTSGGAYYAIADAFLERGGYIVGCVYTEDYDKAIHIAGNSREDLKRIMRSKYFQSDTEGIYRITKRLLKEGKEVLFCGTPCQVSALHNYMGDNCENLYTIDFICRGINSPLAYKKYMEELKQRYESPIQEVHFKNKSQGWLNLGTQVKFDNGKKYYRNRYEDPWVNAFIVGNLYMRYACSECKFKTLPRGSDISLGDFWGLHFKKEEAQLGLSLLMINNEKGKQLLERSKNNMVIEKHGIEEAVNGNPAILNSIPTSEFRAEFFERIKTEKYSDVVWDIIGGNRVARLIKSVIERLKIYIWVRMK